MAAASRNLYSELEYALDPVAWASVVAPELTLDPAQAKVLRSKSRRWLLCCTRQWGKSTTTALRAAHRAIYRPGSLVICVSPTDRQSGLLFDKIADFVRRAPQAPERNEDNKRSMTLVNGSRVVSLPGSPDTIRGYSAPDMVLVDEAAFCEDKLFGAVMPMLATNDGELGLLSSPHGKLGSFYEAWASGDEYWHRIRVQANECPRISPEFLAREARMMPAWLFAQEYMCQFTDRIDAVFSSEQVEGAMVEGKGLFE
jgi:hypothetical protein